VRCSMGKFALGDSFAHFTPTLVESGNMRSLLLVGNRTQIR
jgi:hypothetical protein